MFGTSPLWSLGSWYFGTRTEGTEFNVLGLTKRRGKMRQHKRGVRGCLVSPSPVLVYCGFVGLRLPTRATPVAVSGGERARSMLPMGMRSSNLGVSRGQDACDLS